MLQPLKYCFIGLLILVLFNACRKDNVDLMARENGRDYINQEFDFYVDYQVDSIHYDAFNNRIDTFSFQIRYLNDTFITNSIEENEMRIEQFRRRDSSRKWEIEKAYSLKVNNLNVVRNKNNQKTIVLSFPISENSLWDGNSKNTKASRYFYYQTIHDDYSVNNISFDSTLSIIQEDIDNIAEEKFVKEIYAKNIGLIEKEIINIEKDIKSIKGYKTHYKIIKYGKK